MKHGRALSAGLLLSVTAAALPLPAWAASPAAVVRPAATVEAELRTRADADTARFYAARAWRPLWLSPEGRVDPAAQALVALIESAEFDAVDPGSLGAAELTAALNQVAQDKSPAALAGAELALSRSFTGYVRAIRRAPTAEMAYEADALRPGERPGAVVLQEASQAPSLAEYVREMQWMHPLYAPLRRALADDAARDPALRAVVFGNLERIRALPAAPAARYLLVDTASARLWMYEGGRPVDSMRVVVGKASLQTPMMAGYVRHAIFNPYWNVPQDLVPSRIAPNVVRRGVSYLKASGYEVLSDWGAEATVIDPATIDWRAVARGTAEARVRQLPGGTNAMGRVKFEFPNAFGIYLHDTPDKTLMLGDERQASSGCIRLEDADRLGRWLFNGTPREAGAGPEQKVHLPAVVPVYVTYLTAHVAEGRIAIGPDPYRRDRTQGTAFARRGMSEGAFLQ